MTKSSCLVILLLPFLVASEPASAARAPEGSRPDLACSFGCGYVWSPAECASPLGRFQDRAAQPEDEQEENDVEAAHFTASPFDLATCNSARTETASPPHLPRPSAPTRSPRSPPQ